MQTLTLSIHRHVQVRNLAVRAKDLLQMRRKHILCQLFHHNLLRTPCLVSFLAPTASFSSFSARWHTFECCISRGDLEYDRNLLRLRLRLRERERDLDSEYDLDRDPAPRWLERGETERRGEREGERSPEARSLRSASAPAALLRRLVDRERVRVRPREGVREDMVCVWPWLQSLVRVRVKERRQRNCAQPSERVTDWLAV